VRIPMFSAVETGWAGQEWVFRTNPYRRPYTLPDAFIVLKAEHKETANLQLVSKRLFDFDSRLLASS
jgi:hypothetical protein